MKALSNDQIPMNGLLQLEAIIEDLKIGCHKLEQTVDFKSKQYKLKKTKELISSLNDVYDAITLLKWYDVWAILEKMMDKYGKIDQQLSGFNIHLRTKSTGENFVKIQLP